MGKELFTDRQKEAIQLAIEKAEKDTSGEIRVHVDRKCTGDPVERAIAVFHQLGMHDTTLKNGVLIYLAMDDKKLAIVGDEGINAVVPENFWDDERDLMVGYFKNGQFAEGLIEGIRMVGHQLRIFFPHSKDDANELSNEVTFGENE